MNLNIYLIHNEELIERAQRADAQLNAINDIANKKGYKINSTLVLTPTITQINVEEFQKKVIQERTNDQVFDSLITPFTVESICNREKHKMIWKKISESPNNNDLNLVLEDDFTILEEGIKNFETFLTFQKEKEWDIIFLGFLSESSSSGMELLPIKNLNPQVLPAKESYVINKETAKKLLDDFEKIHFSTRIQMSWYLKNTPSIKALVNLEKQ